MNRRRLFRKQAEKSARGTEFGKGAVPGPFERLYREPSGFPTALSGRGRLFHVEQPPVKNRSPADRRAEKPVKFVVKPNQEEEGKFPGGV